MWTPKGMVIASLRQTDRRTSFFFSEVESHSHESLGTRSLDPKSVFAVEGCFRVWSSAKPPQPQVRSRRKKKEKKRWTLYHSLRRLNSKSGLFPLNYVRGFYVRSCACGPSRTFPRDPAPPPPLLSSNGVLPLTGSAGSAGLWRWPGDREGGVLGR